MLDIDSGKDVTRIWKGIVFWKGEGEGEVVTGEKRRLFLPFGLGRQKTQITEYSFKIDGYSMIILCMT